MTITASRLRKSAHVTICPGAASAIVRMLALLFVWLGGLSVLSPSTGAVYAQERAAAIARITTGKIHLIIVADTDDFKIGESVASDLYHVTDLFGAHVPPHQLQVTTLSGKDVRRKRILETVAAIKINPNLDTVVFYFSGHGAFDPNTKQNFLYGLGQQDACLRSEIREVIQQFRPQLTVIIADTCSIFHRTPVPAPANPPAEIVTPAFRSLFLEPVGLVDINSSQPEQEAEGNSNGGWFTSTFCDYLHDRKNQRLSWNNLLMDVNRGVKSKWRANQTAYAVSPLPQPNNGTAGPQTPVQGVRFGAAAQATARGTHLGGVEVTQVIAGSAATRIQNRKDGGQYRLVVDRDIITHINGIPISTYNEFRQAIAASPNNMVIRVFDRATRSTADYDVALGVAGEPVPQLANRTRFGADVRDSRSGVHVTKVQANSPAMRCQNGDGQNWFLEAGDLITHVNGEAVQTEAQYRAAVLASPTAMQITVIGRKDRKRYNFSVQLND